MSTKTSRARNADGQSYSEPLTNGGYFCAPFYRNIFGTRIATAFPTHFVGKALHHDRATADFSAAASGRPLLYRIKITFKP